MNEFESRAARQSSAAFVCKFLHSAFPQACDWLTSQHYPSSSGDGLCGAAALERGSSGCLAAAGTCGRQPLAAPPIFLKSRPFPLDISASPRSPRGLRAYRVVSPRLMNLSYTIDLGLGILLNIVFADVLQSPGFRRDLLSVFSVAV
ncbi:MAG: hypothetical protein RLZZ511_1835 [Cyanobacteriota bacterium]